MSRDRAGPTTWTTAWRLIGLLGPYRGRLTVALIAMGVLAVAAGAYPILLDLLTTRLVAPKASQEGAALSRSLRALERLGVGLTPGPLVAFVSENLLGIFIAVVIAKGAAQAVRFFSMGALAQHVTRDVRGSLFSRIVHQDMAFFGTRTSGDLLSRLLNDVAQVERTATYAIPVMVGDALRVVVLSAVCLIEYTWLSAIALAVFPAAMLPIVYFGRLLKRYGRRGQEAMAELTRRATETLGGIRTAAVYGGEDREEARFAEAQRGYLQASMKSVLVRAVQTPVMEWVGVLAVVVTLHYALSAAPGEGVRPGEVLGFLLALVLLYEPIKAIGRLSGIVMPGLSAAERVFEMIDRASAIESKPDARVLPEPAREVVFSKVGFRYWSNGEFALEEIDLVLRRGRAVALVGPSGGGKSSIASLVPRLFDVTEGCITVDGLDVRNVRLESLRAQVAMVDQEPYLFDDSVVENIRYGRRTASLEEVRRAAVRARADGFIRALTGGYDAAVGERGMQLSAGQRQRIAIARAFLRNAPILILDEVTSALDRESEEAIRVAVSELVRERAALVIAHRLETVRHAQEIVVVDGGRIVERGVHDALVRQGGWYARWAKEAPP